MNGRWLRVIPADQPHNKLELPLHGGRSDWIAIRRLLHLNGLHDASWEVVHVPKGQPHP
jgi:hypothetical protein